MYYKGIAFRNKSKPSLFYVVYGSVWGPGYHQFRMLPTMHMESSSWSLGWSLYSNKTFRYKYSTCWRQTCRKHSETSSVETNLDQQNNPPSNFKLQIHGIETQPDKMPNFCYIKPKSEQPSSTPPCSPSPLQVTYLHPAICPWGI